MEGEICAEEYPGARQRRKETEGQGLIGIVRGCASSRACGTVSRTRYGTFRDPTEMARPQVTESMPKVYYQPG
jgi:hypothetical protein